MGLPRRDVGDPFADEGLHQSGAGQAVFAAVPQPAVIAEPVVGGGEGEPGWIR